LSHFANKTFIPVVEVETSNIGFPDYFTQHQDRLTKPYLTKQSSQHMLGKEGRSDRLTWDHWQ